MLLWGLVNLFLLNMIRMKKYNIVYEINNASEDFSSTGKVVYEKAPIEYSFILIPDQKNYF